MFQACALENSSARTEASGLKKTRGKKIPSQSTVESDIY